MKNLFLFSISALFVFPTFAQFTITKNNMPGKFNVEYRINDTLGTTISPGSSGANQTWDFSNLQTHIRDTSIFMDPAGTPALASFPKANLVLKNMSGVNGSPKGYIYLEVTDKYFGVLGAYMDNPGSPGMKITPVFKPVEKNLIFPSSYLIAYKDTQVFIYSYLQKNGSVDSVRIKHRVYGDKVIDSYGKVITPTASFTNTLRIKEYYVLADSIEVHVKTGATTYMWQLVQINRDTNTTYSWISDQYKFNVAELNYKGKALKFKNASYLTNLDKANGLSEKIVIENSIHLYPNPATIDINIHIADENIKYISVFDIYGNLITITETNQNEDIRINTSNYSNGIYLYKLTGNTAEILGTGKFSIIK